jgi:hypothetical protein
MPGGILGFGSLYTVPYKVPAQAELGRGTLECGWGSGISVTFLGCLIFKIIRFRELRVWGMGRIWPK